MQNSKIQVFLLLLLALPIFGCAEKDPSFSLLSESDNFAQDVSSFNNKVDILWMVDGSGTMANHQTNLGNNFGAFIGDFMDKGFDYNMVVASSDSWIRENNYNNASDGCSANPGGNPNAIYKSSADCNNTKATHAQLTYFRDGDIYGTAAGANGVRSGQYLISSTMNPADILNLFSINVRTGTRGDGVAEAGLQSLRSVLRRNTNGSVGYGGETHTVLGSFRRNDAFLAVIIISDEEDQSRKQNMTNYANNDEYVNEFVAFMNGYTGTQVSEKRYNVSSIVLSDLHNCSYTLDPQATVSTKYIDIAEATNGVVGNICNADFASQLSEISTQIVTLSTRFKLSREPIPASIVIKVNGAVVPNDATNGWTYVPENGFHYIEFHGTGVPPQGAQISVKFDPKFYGS